MTTMDTANACAESYEQQYARFCDRHVERIAWARMFDARHLAAGHYSLTEFVDPIADPPGLSVDGVRPPVPPVDQDLYEHKVGDTPADAQRKANRLKQAHVGGRCHRCDAPILDEVHRTIVLEGVARTDYSFYKPCGHRSWI